MKAKRNENTKIEAIVGGKKIDLLIALFLSDDNILPCDGYPDEIIAFFSKIETRIKDHGRKIVFDIVIEVDEQLFRGYSNKVKKIVEGITQIIFPVKLSQ